MKTLKAKLESVVDRAERKAIRKEICVTEEMIGIAKKTETDWKHVFQTPMEAKIGVQMAKEIKEYCQGDTKSGKAKPPTRKKIVHSRHMAAYGSMALVCMRINPDAMSFFLRYGTRSLLFCTHATQCLNALLLRL